MNLLQEIEAEFTSGVVSEAGFRWLADAELYGNAASIGALEKRLQLLKSRIVAGRNISVHHPSKGRWVVETEGEFLSWCKEYFPSASVRG